MEKLAFRHDILCIYMEGSTASCLPPSKIRLFGQAPSSTESRDTVELVVKIYRKSPAQRYTFPGETH